MKILVVNISTDELENLGKIASAFGPLVGPLADELFKKERSK